MGDKTEGLREVPRWKRIRAVALMNDGECAGEIPVGQVGIKMREILAVHETLVVERPARQAGYIKLVVFFLIAREHSFSTRRRITYSLRSKSSPSQAPLERNSWLTRGRVDRRVRPSSSSRPERLCQPVTSHFSSTAMFSNTLMPAARRTYRPVEETPCPPHSGPIPAVLSLVGTHFPEKRSGILIRIPAPSPVASSLPTAPRCSRLISTRTASSTIP